MSNNWQLYALVEVPEPLTEAQYDELTDYLTDFSAAVGEDPSGNAVIVMSVQHHTAMGAVLLGVREIQAGLNSMYIDGRIIQVELVPDEEVFASLQDKYKRD